MSIITFEDTLTCLAIERTGSGLYSAPNIPMPYHRIFGGQLLAQLVALGERLAPGKRIKSIQVVFPSEGDLAEPVEYRPTTLREGRTFTTFSVAASQGDRTIAAATLLLHGPEPGDLEHQAASPPNAGSPEDARAVKLSMIPWETRIVGDTDLESGQEAPALLTFFMRTPALESDSVAHRALLAHATDLTLIGTALLPHQGLSEKDSPSRVTTAVTSHSLWFHRDFRLDDWLLLTQSSPVLAGGRGFGRGDVFRPDGRLVASYAQESLIREVR